MDLELKDKVIIMCCSPALAVALASSLQKEGAKSVLHLREGLEDPGCTDMVIRCNLWDHDAVSGLCNDVDKRFGRIDALIYENDQIKEDHLATMDAARLKQRLLPARGAFICCQVFGKYMESRGGGSLLFITTLHDEKPNGSDIAHSMASGMIENLVMEASLEYGYSGIRVNQIAVGATEELAGRFPSKLTSFYEGCKHKVPLGRLGTAGEVADAALFLTSARASFINGARIRVDGGMQMHYLDFKANYRAASAKKGGE